jgi:DNA-binding NarL/FixJ family response regulator
MKDEIDLVILDYILPKLTGKEILKELKKIAPGVRVLVTSGYSENGQARKILEEGVDGFIQKPSQLALLAKKVRELLGEK